MKKMFECFFRLVESTFHLFKICDKRLAAVLNKVTLLLKQNPLFKDGDFLEKNPIDYLTNIQKAQSQ